MHAGRRTKPTCNKLCTLSNFNCICHLLIFFLKKSAFSKKTILGSLSERQTVSIQIRTNVLSTRTWVQTVCKGYQQTTEIAAGKERDYQT